MRSHYAAVKRIDQQIEKIDALLDSLPTDGYDVYKGVKLPASDLRTVVLKERDRLTERRAFHSDRSEKIESEFVPSAAWDKYVVTVKNWTLS